MTRTNIPTRPRRPGERGVALALALFAMATLLIGATGAMLVGADDIHASRNYRGAQQAKYAAESGLTHALQAVNAVGIVNFQSELVDNWDNWLGDGALAFALPGYSYRVVPIGDATNPLTLGWLRAIATGPEGVANVEVARVQQANIPGVAPGAIYLANSDPTNSTFMGNNFFVNGNDHLLDGSVNPAGVAQPGVATRTQSNTEEAVDSLGVAQLDNIQGLGYQAGPPIVPSVKTAPSGANVSQLNALVDSLLAQPGVQEFGDTYSQINNSNSAGFQAPACGIGCCTETLNQPVISHFTSDELKIKGNGNIAGCGIMVIDGDFVIQGTMDFIGLIIVRGGTVIEPDSELGITGNASIYGSLWTSNLNLTVGGSALVKYSTQALSFANAVMPTGAMPAPLDVLALVDCSQVPSGTAGCP